MPLADLAAIGSLISGFAVTASLIYLALQTHQNTKHTKALMNQGQSNRVVATLLTFASSDISAAWIAGNGGAPTPDAVKDLQFAQVCNAVIYDAMDFYNQHRDGLMSDEVFGSTEVAYSSLLQQPGMRAYWESWKGTRQHKAPNFIAWIDSLAATPTAQTSPNWI